MSVTKKETNAMAAIYNMLIGMRASLEAAAATIDSMISEEDIEESGSLCAHPPDSQIVLEPNMGSNSPTVYLCKECGGKYHADGEN